MQAVLVRNVARGSVCRPEGSPAPPNPQDGGVDIPVVADTASNAAAVDDNAGGDVVMVDVHSDVEIKQETVPKKNKGKNVVRLPEPSSDEDMDDVKPTPKRRSERARKLASLEVGDSDDAYNPSSANESGSDDVTPIVNTRSRRQSKKARAKPVNKRSGGARKHARPETSDSDGRPSSTNEARSDQGEVSDNNPSDQVDELASDVGAISVDSDVLSVDENNELNKRDRTGIIPVPESFKNIRGLTHVGFSRSSARAVGVSSDFDLYW